MKKYDNLVKKIPKSMKMYENFGKKSYKYEMYDNFPFER